MCNCKKTKQVETQVITGTPEPLIIEPITPTEEEITEFIKHKDGRSNGETE